MTKVLSRTFLLLLSVATTACAFSAAPASSHHQEEQGLLFSFRADGTEVNALLPDLNRRIEHYGCFFEPSDDNVIALLETVSAGTAAWDACWALDACRGDRTSAALHIRLAQERTLLLRRQEQQQQRGTGPTIDLDSYEGVPLEWLFRRHVQKMKKEKGGIGGGRITMRRRLGPKLDIGEGRRKGVTRRGGVSRRNIVTRFFRKEGRGKNGLVHIALFLGLCRFIFGPGLMPMPFV